MTKFDDPASILDGILAADGSHRYMLRIFYEDTDAGGIVYHANYLRFMERGRTAMLHRLGWRQSDIRSAEGVAFAVRRMTIDYLAPALLDDTLEVVTKIDDIRGASFAAAQSVTRDGRTLVAAAVTVAAIDGRGRAVRIPAAVRRSLDEMRLGPNTVAAAPG